MTQDREQEHRLRRAAWAIAYWGRLSACFSVWYFLTLDYNLPPAWWLPFVTEMAARRVRKGEGLTGILSILVIGQIYSIGGLWLVADGELYTGGRQTQARLLAFAASHTVLIGVALAFTRVAWAHAPRPERPERTPAQISRHRQLAGLVLLAGGLVSVAVLAFGIDAWQRTGHTSHGLKTVVFALLLAWIAWLLGRAVSRGKAIDATSALLIPLLIGMVGVAAAGLIFQPIAEPRWFLTLVLGLAAFVALVITMRGILGGERKGQGDAG